MAADSQSSSSDDETDTQSLTDSIMDYPMHWERRYHKYKEGSYAFPNDEPEQDRLDVQYTIIKAVQNEQLFLSPLKDPRRILDVGTGTGIWAIELSDSNIFPDARITGIDLSPIQPLDVPENVFFEVQDCSETDWERPPNSFDFIYSRCMLGALSDFAQYIRTARKYLRPGSGWLECCDIHPQPFSDDNTMPLTWSFVKWEEAMDRGARRAGRPLRTAHKFRQWMEEAGFVDVQEHVHKIPIGTWPADKLQKRIGRAWKEMLLEMLPAVSYKTLNEQLNWSREEVELMLADTRKGLQDRTVHAYHKVYTVYGRRPSAEEEKRAGRMRPPPLPTLGQSSQRNQP